MKRLLYLFLLIILLIVAGIFLKKNDPPDHSISENQLASKAYVQDTSQLILPVNIDITSFEGVLNNQLDAQGSLYEEKNIEVNQALSISFEVTKNGLAQLYPENGKIQVQVPLLINIIPQISGPLSFGIGKDLELSARVILHSTILPDINSDWELMAQSSTSFDIIESPKLNIAGIDIDFKKQLQASLEMGKESINQEIESSIKQTIQTKEIIELIWAEIKTPYLLTDEPVHLWTMVKPIRIFASDLTPSQPGTMQIQFIVDAFIDIKSGQRPIKINTAKLPQAKRIKSQKETKSILNFPLVIPYETFTQYLNELEEGIDFNINKSRKVSLSSLNAFKKGNLLVISSNFTSGEAKGVLTITGIPQYDAEEQTISLKVMDLTTDSNQKYLDQLLESFANIQQIKQTIEQNLTYSIAEDLADLTFDITNQIKATQFHEYAKLNGYVNKITVQDIYLREKDLLIDTQFDCSLNCNIKSD